MVRGAINNVGLNKQQLSALFANVLTDTKCALRRYTAQSGVAAINDPFGSKVNTWGCDFSQAPKERA